MEEWSLVELIGLYRSGNNCAGDEIYQRCKMDLLCAARSAGFQTATAEDLVQVTFVRFFERLSIVEYADDRHVRNSLRAFLGKCMQEERRRILPNSCNDGKEIEPTDTKTPAPEHALFIQERREWFEQHRAHFSVEEYDLLWQFHVEGVPYGELAERFGKSVEALRMCAFRARARLRELLIADGWQPDGYV